MTIRNPIDILTRVTFVGAIALIISSCAAPDTQHHIVVSIREQKLALLDRDNLIAIYPVSTSKFGLGDWPGSSFTPLGELEIAKKNWRQCAAWRGIQRSTPHRRNRRGGFPGSGSDRDTHSLAAWARGAKRKCVCSDHLYPRHAGGTEHRLACELWMHPDALKRHHTIVRHRGSRRCSHHRGRATCRRGSESHVRSLNGRNEYSAIRNAVGTSRCDVRTG